jgi:hypothetical protein
LSQVGHLLCLDGCPLCLDSRGLLLDLSVLDFGCLLFGTKGMQPPHHPRNLRYMHPQRFGNLALAIDSSLLERFNPRT